MCSLIALLEKNKLVVAMNRDDKIERTHESDISTKEFWYPQDRTAKGTWLGVHVDGTVYALMNAYAQSTEKSVHSRGEIIPKLLSGKILNNFSGYAPFRLYTIQKEGAHILYWSGKQSQQRNVSLPCISASSSYGKRSEKEQIIKEFLRQETSIEDTLQKHDRDIIASPCLHGPNSDTIASHIITIEKNNIQIYEKKGHPCNSNYTQLDTLFSNHQFLSS